MVVHVVVPVGGAGACLAQPDGGAAAGNKKMRPLPQHSIGLIGWQQDYILTWLHGIEQPGVEIPHIDMFPRWSARAASSSGDQSPEPLSKWSTTLVAGVPQARGTQDGLIASIRLCKVQF